MEKELETFFHRVNNDFIRRLSLSFDHVSLPLLQGLRQNASNLQCHVITLHIGDTSEAIDNALVDFVGDHLKPQVYELSTDVDTEFSENHAMLFTHDALRGNVAHLVYTVSKILIGVRKRGERFM